MLSIIEFKTQYRANKEPVDWVLAAPKGEGHQRTQTWHRVSKIIPPENVDEREKEAESYQDMAAKWSVIGPAYRAWKDGNEIPEHGTPLAAWSGVTPEIAGILKSMGIKTVEDVVSMGDGALAQIKFPNARQLPKLAAEYLSGTDAAARDAENAELKERLAAMEEMLKESMETKRKPGRPKKEVEAA